MEGVRAGQPDGRGDDAARWPPCGCLELRFGIESGSDRVLKRIKKGFTAAADAGSGPQGDPDLPARGHVLRLGLPVRDDGGLPPVALPDGLVPHDGRADSAQPAVACCRRRRSTASGAAKATLEFCPCLLPEFVFTGHEVCRGGGWNSASGTGNISSSSRDNPDIFPGLLPHRPGGQRPAEAGTAPPVRVLSAAEPEPRRRVAAPSPRIEPQELATRVAR